MLRRLLLYLFAVGVFLLPVSPLHARERVQGWCEQGGNTLAVIGAIVTSDKAQESFPGCTVTVWATGTVNLSVIFSDDVGTIKANPFTADLTTGLWSFYADNARYDIQLSGGGLAAPFTLSDFLLDDSAQTVTTIAVVASSATPVFDVGKASILTNILTANVTSSTITNGVTGQIITIYLAQDGTGGWTFVWPANVQLRAGGYVVSDDASAVSTIKLYFDGANWREIGWDADEVGRDLIPTTASGRALGSDSSPSARWDIFWRKSEGRYNVKGYGAVGDGTTDDTTAIQAAFTACAAEDLRQIPIVYFPPGEYVVTSALTVGRCHLLGAFPVRSTRIDWDGTNGTGPVITQSTGASYWMVKNIMFTSDEDGTAPNTWISVTPRVDLHLDFPNTVFFGSTDDAIQFPGGWFILHLSGPIRFTAISGWAIDATAVAGMNNQQSFMLESFTYDNRNSTSPLGLIRFDNSAGAASGIGVIRISDARIEINTAFGGNQAPIQFDGDSSTSGWAKLHLMDVAYQDVIGMAGDTLIYSVNGPANGVNANVILENVVAGPISAVLGGDWGGRVIDFANNAFYPFSSIGSGVGGGNQGTYLFEGPPVQLVAFNGAVVDALRFRRRGDSDNRFQVGIDGELQWCDGVGTCDVILERSAANVLSLGSGDELHLQGDLNHDGSNVGFFGAAPAAQPSTTAEIKAALSSLGLLQDGGATPLDLDGGVLTVTVTDPLEGTLSNVPRWIFKQVDHTDMTAAATADSFTLWTLPANTMIHDVVGRVPTAWAGAGPVTAALCSIGTQAGSDNDLALDDNVFAPGTRYELHDATAPSGKGTLLFDTTDKFAPNMLIAGGVIEIQCDLTGGNHADTTAGRVLVYTLVSQPLANTTVEAN